MPTKMGFEADRYYLRSTRPNVGSIPLESYFGQEGVLRQNWTIDSLTYLAESEGGSICEDATRIQDAVNGKKPLLLRKPDLYLFGNNTWLLSEKEQSHNIEQLRLIILEELNKERQKAVEERDRFERLKKKFSGAELDDNIQGRRELISEKVRMFVWRRDGGRCAECGSKEKLEFDHIIPFSKGGSSTERNIQLLCEPCNRKKSATI